MSGSGRAPEYAYQHIGCFADAKSLLTSSDYTLPPIAPAELSGGGMTVQQIEAVLLYHRNMKKRMQCAYPFDPERRKLQALVRRHQMGAFAETHRAVTRDAFDAILGCHPPGLPLVVNDTLATPLALAAVNSLLGTDFKIAELGDAHSVGYKLLLTGLPPMESLEGWLSISPVVSAISQALAERNYAPDALLAAFAEFAHLHGRSRDFIIMSCVVILMTGTSLNRSLVPILRLALNDAAVRRALIEDDTDAAFEELLRLNPPQPMVFRYHADDSTSGCKRFTSVDIREANRDPERFDAPDRFDPARPRTSALTFGVGPFACDGASMTRIFLRESVHALLSRTQGLRLLDGDGDQPAALLYDRFE